MNTSKLSRRQKNVLSWLYRYQFVETSYDAEHLDTLGVGLDPQTGETAQKQNVNRAMISRIFRRLEERELLKRTLHKGRLYVKLTDASVNVALPFYTRDVERGRWESKEPETTQPQPQPEPEVEIVDYSRFFRVGSH